MQRPAQGVALAVHADGVRAGFQRDVDGCAARRFSGGGECRRLRVRRPNALMKALADEAAVAYDDRADHGVGMRPAARAKASARRIQRASSGVFGAVRRVCCDRLAFGRFRGAPASSRFGARLLDFAAQHALHSRAVRGESRRTIRARPEGGYRSREKQRKRQEPK